MNRKRGECVTNPRTRSNRSAKTKQDPNQKIPSEAGNFCKKINKGNNFREAHTSKLSVAENPCEKTSCFFTFLVLKTKLPNLNGLSAILIPGSKENKSPFRIPCTYLFDLLSGSSVKLKNGKSNLALLCP